MNLKFTDQIKKLSFEPDYANMVKKYNNTRKTITTVLENKETSKSVDSLFDYFDSILNEVGQINNWSGLASNTVSNNIRSSTAFNLDRQIVLASQTKMN